jgi:hypothetical protein
VEVDMPGVAKDGLEVTIKQNEIAMVGRWQTDRPPDDLYYCESDFADCRRVFELGPDIDTAKSAASSGNKAVFPRFVTLKDILHDYSGWTVFVLPPLALSSEKMKG